MLNNYDIFLIIIVQGVVHALSLLTALLLFAYVLKNKITNGLSNSVNTNQNLTNITPSNTPSIIPTESESLMSKIINFAMSFIINKLTGNNSMDKNDPIYREKLNYIDDNTEIDSNAETNTETNTDHNHNTHSKSHTHTNSNTDDIDSDDLVINNNHIHEQVINNYNIENRQFEENKNTEVVFDKTSCFGCFGNMFSFGNSNKPKKSNKKQK